VTNTDYTHDSAHYEAAHRYARRLTAELGMPEPAARRATWALLDAGALEYVPELGIYRPIKAVETHHH